MQTVVCSSLEKNTAIKQVHVFAPRHAGIVLLLSPPQSICLWS